jgi:hypothetical protein
VPVLVAVLLPVVAYCSLRAVAPRWRGSARSEHRRGTDVWHVVMGLAMIAMVLGTLGRALAILALAVCAAGLCWGVLSVERRTGGAARFRLMVGAGAMAVMTLPLAAPAVAAGGSGSGSTGTGAMNAMAGMNEMAGMSGIPVPLVLALLVGLLVVAATRLPSVVRRSPGGTVTRLDAGCDVVMAGAMAVMLVVLV